MARTRDLLNLSYVKRWVIAPLHREQSVAEHSFRVAVLVRGLAYHLCRLSDPPTILFDVYRAILLAIDHDADECFTGDIPGTHKDTTKPWADPGLMLYWEIAVKVADAIETYDWWQRHGVKEWNHPMAPERGSRNRDIRKIVHYTRDRPELLQAVRNLMQQEMGYDDLVLRGLFDGD